MYLFTVNGKQYRTDKDTLDLLRLYKSQAKNQLFGIVFEVGLKYGRITPTK